MASLEAPRRITELDAINLILENAGEGGVSSIGPTSKPTAQKAQRFLAEESIRLQSEGHNFCTLRELELQPNTDGEILLPDNILSVSQASGHYGLEVQEDGNRLFNASDNRTTFDAPITVEVVLAQPFGRLAQPVRWLVSVTAAMRFLNSENPGSAGLRVTSADVAQANVSFQRYDRRLRKGGLRQHNPFIKRMRGNR